MITIYKKDPLLGILVPHFYPTKGENSMAHTKGWARFRKAVKQFTKPKFIKGFGTVQLNWKIASPEATEKLYAGVK